MWRISARSTSYPKTADQRREERQAASFDRAFLAVDVPSRHQAPCRMDRVARGARDSPIGVGLSWRSIGHRRTAPHGSDDASSDVTGDGHGALGVIFVAMFTQRRVSHTRARPDRSSDRDAGRESIQWQLYVALSPGFLFSNRRTAPLLDPMR